ncbi:MAG: sulfite exporter TauE/SafE family protein [Coriobacteriales bacterium]|jgi:uncharacterized membrane protein YfcA|nr:sulfite exporter TauE/SafE family protein [Coriobacteriales bacterium]
MDPLAFILIVLCGFLVGILAGLFGVGGGWMIIPLLHVIFGVPVVPTAATSLFTMVPTSVSGVIRHMRQKTVHLRIGVILGVSGAVTSVGGALVAEHLPDMLITLLTVAVIAFSALRMLWEARQAAAASDPASVPASPAASDSATSFSTTAATSSDPVALTTKPITIVAAIIVGLIAGFLAGIVGVGGGFIIVPFCVAYLGFSMSKAAGTSLAAIMFIALPGIVSHAMLGHIWWLYGIALIIGTVPGAQLGGYLASRLPDRALRIAFVCLLVVAGGMLLYQQFAA